MADENKPAVDKDEIRNALEEIKNEDAQKNEMTELRNAISELKAANAKMSDELKALKPAPAEAANADDADKDKDAEAAHGLPAQEVVKAYAKHYGRDFGRVTPSFAALAEIAELKGETIAEKARAVVAHAKALEAGETRTTDTEHSAGVNGISFAGFAQAI